MTIAVDLGRKATKQTISTNCAAKCDFPNSYNDMVQCDSKECQKWFHFKCVGLTSATLFYLVQLTCKQFLQTVLIYWEASIFTPDNGVLTLFCFLKTMCVLGHREADFQSSFYAVKC